MCVGRAESSGWLRVVAVVGSCGAHSFLEAKGTKLRGSAGVALSLAETEADVGTASGLVKRMNGIPDADAAVSAARSAVRKALRSRFFYF